MNPTTTKQTKKATEPRRAMCGNDPNVSPVLIGSLSSKYQCSVAPASTSCSRCGYPGPPQTKKKPPHHTPPPPPQPAHNPPTPKTQEKTNQHPTPPKQQTPTTPQQSNQTPKPPPPNTNPTPQHTTPPQTTQPQGQETTQTKNPLTTAPNTITPPILKPLLTPSLKSKQAVKKPNPFYESHPQSARLFRFLGHARAAGADVSKAPAQQRPKNMV